MKIPPFVALEIGSSRIVALVGEVDADGNMVVVGKGLCPSQGVRKGRIVNLQNSSHCVMQAINQAIDESTIDIGRVILAIGGGGVTTEFTTGSVPIRSKDRVISAEDVEDAIENASNVSVSSQNMLLHSISQDFRIDGVSSVDKPEGLTGTNLSHNMIAVIVEKSIVENVKTVAAEASLDVEDVVFSPICASLSVLSPMQKKSGVAVVDLGGGTTSYIAYVNNTAVSMGSISVGGDHVTNDISLAFSIPHNRAEDIKIEYGNALIGGGKERISVPADFNLSPRTISSKALRTVINARVDETLRIVRTKFLEEDILQKLSAGIIFTGGGAAMPGLTELASSIFGIPCSVGLPRNVLGLENVEDKSGFAVASGLLLYDYNSWKKSNHKPFETIRKLFGL